MHGLPLRTFIGLGLTFCISRLYDILHCQGTSCFGWLCKLYLCFSHPKMNRKSTKVVESSSNKAYSSLQPVSSQIRNMPNIGISIKCILIRLTWVLYVYIFWQQKVSFFQDKQNFSVKGHFRRRCMLDTEAAHVQTRVITKLSRYNHVKRENPYNPWVTLSLASPQIAPSLTCSWESFLEVGALVKKK